MPEGPELHLASLFVNKVCTGLVFTGAVQKSAISKCPEVPFTSDAYSITAISRGKEVRLTLNPIRAGKVNRAVAQSMDVVFRFGMSGYFSFNKVEELPKHAHLRFYTKEKIPKVLSFVDPRRFGSWQPNGTWQAERGPCVMLEYQQFRLNVLSHLSDRSFEKPICEALLNQKYFNGIGNYLRAEILHRLSIPPFVKARNVLERLQTKEASGDEWKLSEDEAPNEKLRTETADLLSLCHTVPMEVVNLGEKGYEPAKKDYSVLMAWMQCYSVEGMMSLRDHNGRTIWFKGDAGPMAPKGRKLARTKKRKLKDDDDDNGVAKDKPSKKLPKGRKGKPGNGCKKAEVKQEIRQWRRAASQPGVSRQSSRRIVRLKRNSGSAGPAVCSVTKQDKHQGG
ncbi:endonuclease 8-like 1 isoform X1 [Paramormyrops kingsleyae]|uniref:endonuclease 8-like 1 isoform X1 n=1 Tax=Paramormyrops kingsleyae TaxID=1676925 RepID=UPI000CD60B67|nr:endonuclease 8-like 1 isoform X1 [Paramormyrops kingsleyae]